MGMVGLSEVMESWKIMATSLPRTSRICFSVRLTRSRPLSLIDPPTMWPPLGSSLIIDSPVMDLPQPDSPTRPRVSPVPMARLTLPTAWTTERDSFIWVERSSTSITGWWGRATGQRVAVRSSMAQRRLRRTSTVSRMASPMKLKAMTTATRQTPTG